VRHILPAERIGATGVAQTDVAGCKGAATERSVAALACLESRNESTNRLRAAG
jgi:hypothetical protein